MLLCYAFWASRLNIFIVGFRQTVTYLLPSSLYIPKIWFKKEGHSFWCWQYGWCIPLYRFTLRLKMEFFESLVHGRRVFSLMVMNWVSGDFTCIVKGGPVSHPHRDESILYLSCWYWKGFWAIHHIYKWLSVMLVVMKSFRRILRKLPLSGTFIGTGTFQCPWNFPD